MPAYRISAVDSNTPCDVFSATRDLLPVIYATRERGKIQVKGKGEMTTFWLENKANRNPPHQSEVSPTFISEAFVGL